MKKSLLTVATLFLAFGLVACDGNGDSASTSGKTSASQGQGSASVSAAPITLDVPADKTAYVMKLGEGSVELSSYNSVFLTGDMAQVDEKGTWAKGLDAIEMKTGVLDGYLVGYSAKYEPAEDSAQANQYQVVVGYNSTAEIADSKKGLVWNNAYKSDECLSFGGESGLGNPTFTYDAEKRIADLGTHTFKSQPAAPQPALKNFKLKVSFATSVPEYAVPHLLGSYNGWDTNYTAELEEATRMTVVEGTERKDWTLNIGDTYADSYEWTMSIDYTIEAKADQTNFSWKKPDQLAAGNLPYTVLQIMGDDATMDLTEGDPLTFDFDANLPDPSQKANLKIVVTTEGEAVAEGLTLCVTGSFTGWAAQDMVASDDRKTFTLELTEVTAGKLEFGITLKGETNWAHSVVAAEGANITQQFTASEDSVITIVADLAAAFNGEAQKLAYTSIELAPWTVAA